MNTDKTAPAVLTAKAAAKIRQIMADRGITQARLGAAAGMQQSDVSRLLKAGRNGETWATSLATLVRVAAALGMPVEELVADGSLVLTLGTVGASPFDTPTVYSEPLAIYTPRRYPAGCFALVVTGHSCSRFGVCDGDTVIVQATTDRPERKLVVLRCVDGHSLKLSRGGKFWQFSPDDTEPVEFVLDKGTNIAGVVIDRHGEPWIEPLDKPAKKRRK